jgi:hypothetical protein
VAIRQRRPYRPPIAEQPFVTMKAADYILVAGFERPDIFEMVPQAPHGHRARLPESARRNHLLPPERP